MSWTLAHCRASPADMRFMQFIGDYIHSRAPQRPIISSSSSSWSWSWLGFAQRPDAFSLIVIVCGNLISAFSTRVCTFSLPLSSLSPSPSRRHVCPLCVCVFVWQRNFACSCQDLDLFNNAGYVMDLLKACPHVSVLHSPFSACVCHKLSPCPWLEASLFN